MSTSTESQSNSFLSRRLRSLPWIATADRFFDSPVYLLLIALLTLVGNFFSLELPVYSIFILICGYLCLFGRDLLPVIPIAISCYIVPSVGNNPGRNPNSVFYPQHGGIVLLALAGIFLVLLILRLATDPEIGKKHFFTEKRGLMPGMLALGGAYLLSGLGSGHAFDHGFGNLLFSILQFLAVFALYYLFTGCVQWEKAPKNYLAWTGLAVGYVLVAQIAWIYLTQPILVNGEIDRNLIYSGWGNYNNMAALLVMMIPFAFQLAGKQRHSWVYFLSGVLFFLGVVASCSRSSMFVGCLVFLAALGMSLAENRQKSYRVTAAAMLFAGILCLLILHQPLLQLFHRLLNVGLISTDRLQGYWAGLQQFWDYPVFGGGFYPVDFDLYAWSQVEAFSAFFPPRWHNTVVQLAASCGVVGLAAYLWHRWQTLRLLIRKPARENCYLAVSIAALLITSLLDCHFFNIGPTLFYSMALAFGEKFPVDSSK